MKTRHLNIFVAVAAILLSAGSVFSMTDRLSPALQQVAERSEAVDTLINVVIFLEDRSAQHNLQRAMAPASMSRDARIKQVIGRLTSNRAEGAESVRQLLTDQGAQQIREFWIVPSFAARVSSSNLNELAEHESIRMIVEDVSLSFDEPIDVQQGSSLATSVSDQLRMLNVPQLWQLGLTGQGRLVCSFDTGVEGTHPALSTKWRGNSAAQSASWYSPVNPTSQPYDVAGHGTHTMGIMVGSTPTDTFGVAPDAQWISAGVVDQGRPFNTTLADIVAAFQWALNPDGDVTTTDDVPDVILNSWGIPAGLFEPCDDTFWEVIDAVEAAGIVTIFAAGNEGPNPQTLRDPADRATSPLNSFSIGAVDNNRVVAGFSSRGPSRCDNSQIKPEVMAPGVSVLSATKGGGYAYMSGTSMAAPYIAGLVALCREYNPDATVEEIKTAFINAAIDLGPVGEDNAYGHGLVDASQLLGHLPMPGGYDFTLVGAPSIDGGIALPGSESYVQLTLTNAAGNTEAIEGELISQDPESAIVLEGLRTFLFGSGGTTSVNQLPFTISLDSSLLHGTELGFSLYLSLTNGTVVDTIDFTITAGYPSPGHLANHASGRLTWTVSDFGQYGLAAGSIYNLGGAGFAAADGDNLLYEAGIIVGRNTVQLSSSIRGADGGFRPSDFTPQDPLQLIEIDDNGMVRYRARMVDTYSEIPIPISIRQETIHFTESQLQGAMAVRYRLVNSTLERLTHLSFGFFTDFDLRGGNEQITYDESAGIIWQENSAGELVGLVAIEGIESFAGWANSDGKSGLTIEEQHDLISGAETRLDDSTAGDMMMLAVSGPHDINVADSIQLVIGLVVGDDLAELYANAQAVRQAMDIATDVDDNRHANLPEAFELEQNYPNPFNPTTTIAFTLSTATEVGLDIFNSLGQRVRQLHQGTLTAGTHQIEWDSRDDRGQEVASGVYFYRLSTPAQSASRKMILLK
ncbi:S8 family serine peptidase [candidate division GN15 bacterium]|nr:S8 family serine peptidase [candidate division GN15 bacterium]